MSDIYLAISETPTVVTLTSAVINSAVASTVTVANTVTVALDANSLSALENVTVTVGAAITGTVTVSNFPATQVIASGNVNVGACFSVQDGDGETFGIDRNFPISGTVTVGNTVNFLSGSDSDTNLSENIALAIVSNNILGITNALPAGTNRIGVVTIGAGTVTIGAGTAEIGTVKPAKNQSGNAQFLSVDDGSGKLFTSTLLTAGTAQIGSVTASISNSVTIGSLPAISGTVTANIAISSTAITSGSFASLTSATLVPGNVARKMSTVYNLGAGQLFVNAGASATTLGGGFMVALSSGDYFECDYTTTTLSALYATAGTCSWVSH